MNALATFFSTDGFLIGTILPFLFVLMVVVFVHEMGHYLVGRWCGIGVDAFSIGFGPEIFGFNDRHGTRWSLSLIPLGGYVKFTGDMNVTSTPDDEATAKLTPEQRSVAFHTQAVWKRALTVFAGPFANFLLAIAVFSGFLMAYGDAVTSPVARWVSPLSPADRAGFEKGDLFLSVDGKAVHNFDEVRRYVSLRGGDELTFVVQRGDAQKTFKVVPEMMDQIDALGNPVKVAVIGVRSVDVVDRAGYWATFGTNAMMKADEDARLHRRAYGPVQAVAEATRRTGYIISSTGVFLQRFIMGRESRCHLGGPVKIADMASKAAKVGFDWLVQIMAFLSVSIGLMNLLPIPPLDGGHLMFYAYEAAARRRASTRVMEVIYTAGFLLVAGFMVFALFNDLGCSL